MIIHDQMFICFNPPKTGTMFRYERYRHLGIKGSFHLTQVNMRNNFTNLLGDLSEYHKCVVVRNPWKRWVSFFRMFHRHLPMHEQQKIFKQKAMKTNLKPMHDHYMHDDHVCVDKIYQFEDFDCVVRDMDKILGVDTQIKTHNEQYDYDDYKSWFDQELIDFISEKEHKTIELIGYTF